MQKQRSDSLAVAAVNSVYCVQRTRFTAGTHSHHVACSQIAAGLGPDMRASSDNEIVLHSSCVCSSFILHAVCLKVGIIPPRFKTGGIDPLYPYPRGSDATGLEHDIF